MGAAGPRLWVLRPPGPAARPARPHPHRRPGRDLVHRLPARPGAAGAVREPAGGGLPVLLVRVRGRHVAAAVRGHRRRPQGRAGHRPRAPGRVPHPDRPRVRARAHHPHRPGRPPRPLPAPPGPHGLPARPTRLLPGAARRGRPGAGHPALRGLLRLPGPRRLQLVGAGAVAALHHPAPPRAGHPARPHRARTCDLSSCPSTRRSPSSSAAASCTSTRSCAWTAPATTTRRPAPPSPTDVLEDAVRTAASRVRLVVGPLREDAPALALRFGDQTDVTPLRNSAGGPVTPERVAAYIAKYATKSAEDFGLGGGRTPPRRPGRPRGCRRTSSGPARLLGAGRRPRPRGGPPLAAHARVPRALLHEVPPVLHHPRPAARRPRRLPPRQPQCRRPRAGDRGRRRHHSCRSQPGSLPGSDTARPATPPSPSPRQPAHGNTARSGESSHAQARNVRNEGFEEKRTFG